MPVRILESDYDAWSTLDHFEKQNLEQAHFGACAAFTGSMRDFNQGDSVIGMTLEHYPGMTEKQLEVIIDEAKNRWPLDEALIIHRVGQINPGETIVLTACWSIHRADAFEACRFLMEELKTRAPFWKNEKLADNSNRWVEKNTPGRCS